jgi:predicted RNA binding protein YcfA (HicA-like mRNA interferase family)
MSPRLPRVTALQAERAIRRDGWTYLRQTGSHRHFAHPTKTGIVTIPVHAGETLKPKTLASIIDDAGLTVEEFRRLL